MITIATMLWDANSNSKDFSKCYNETWVDKLYRGFKRNLTQDFHFAVFVDRERSFKEPVNQVLMETQNPDYGCFIEPFQLNIPMILVGLDTLVVGNVDHFADYCLNEKRLALPRNPYKLDESINGVALIPAGHRFIYDDWNGENDMEWLRRYYVNFIDDLFPGQVLSCKAHLVRIKGPQQARIIYFHGRPKMHELMQFDWVRKNWY